MTTKSIEQALDSLLPTLNSVLPPELVNLAASLLAQSRTRASSLKPEEEIARPYVCADIACKRLRTRLNLPSTQPRPPCAPRVYKKLYAFLEPLLQLKVKRKLDDASTPQSSPRSTPRKTNATSANSTPVTTPRTRNLFAGTIGNEASRSEGLDKDPAWILPLTRRLCKSFSTPQLPPHVLAGTTTVLRLAGLYGETVDGQRDLSSLVIALYFMTLTKMRRGQLLPSVYVAQAERALQIAGLDASTRKDEVDDWIKRISEEGWAKGQEWWDNVPEDVLDEEVEDVEEDNEDHLAPPRKRQTFSTGEANGLLPGLGTMMQDKVDWLSDDRRADFQRWKQAVTVRLNQLEKQQMKAQKVR